MGRANTARESIRRRLLCTTAWDTAVTDGSVAEAEWAAARSGYVAGFLSVSA